MPVSRARWTTAGIDVEHRLDGLVMSLARSGIRPGIGLTGPAGRRDELLGLELRTNARPVEQWLRGTDAVAVYEPDDQRGLRATAMWRIAPYAPEPAAAWELVVSAQTSLLDSDASVTVVSTVRADATLTAAWPAPGSPVVWRAPAGRRQLGSAIECLLLRNGTDASSVLIATHPGDPGGLATVTENAGRVRVECPLFADRLEKGVLLRGRVLAAVGPRNGDEAWASAAATAFAASPPVLQT